MIPAPTVDPNDPNNFTQWKAWVDSVIASGQNVQPGMAAPAKSGFLGMLGFGGGKSRRRSKSKRSKSRRTRR